jgi:phosphoribosylformylglycinamidine synthase
VALAEAAFGGWLGAEVTLPCAGLSTPVQLFAESHSRFLVTIEPRHQEGFEAVMGAEATLLGTVSPAPRVTVRRDGGLVLDETVAALFSAWNRDLEG